MKPSESANNLPEDLVLVRHGRSRQNEAYEASVKGDNSYYTDEYRRTPSRNHRLTNEGVEQAKAAGKWLAKEFGDGFDRYFVSTFDRAQETAAYLNLKGAEWEIKRTLVERSWGDYDHIPLEEQLAKYAERMQRDKADAFFSRPPNGDSMNDICNNIGATIMSWRQVPVGKRVIMVTHGEVMTAMRYVFEHLDHYQWYQLTSTKDPKQKIHNAQILHYSRRNPKSGELDSEFRWYRSVCPWDQSLSMNEWVELKRPTSYSAEQLLELVDGEPPQQPKN